jgi:hypothetical protein
LILQDEVMELAQQEMRESNAPVMSLASSSSTTNGTSSSSNKGAKSGSTAAAPQDLQVSLVGCLCTSAYRIAQL